MPLAAGQTLTHYEILGPLGAGGMGEVYRARDTRLEREVAIKVLPEEMADDEERLRRFEREAKTLASLNHPNVAGIHGVDQVEDICFLALELVPGQDLGELLAGGPLPVGEAIDVCRQVAEGLEAAHEAGVVHRDLKPANVRVTPEGVVKILDFGLAKPSRPGPSGEPGTTSAQPDSFLVTEEGLVLGTPTYMSPEQARGKVVDRRTDIWAFGCVLYECLTGKRAFTGESFTDVVAAIVGKEPDASRLPSLPPHVRDLLGRCLEKDPRRRLRDIGEARVRLEQQHEPEDEAASGSNRRGRLAVAFALGALVGAVGVWLELRAEAPLEVEPGGDVVLDLPAETEQYEGLGSPVISPDGRYVAFEAAPRGEEVRTLWVRELGTGEIRRMLEVSETTRPFWSPDGETIGVIVPSRTGEGGLELLPLNGDVSRKVPFEDPLGASWSSSGSIVVARPEGGLWVVPESGGEPEQLSELDTAHEEAQHLPPTFLPDGDRFLFLAVVFPGPQGRLYAGSLSERSVTFIGEFPTRPWYTDRGELVYAEQGRMRSIDFDPLTLQLVGTPRTIAGSVHENGAGSGAYSVSRDGTVVFQSFTGADDLVWFDGEGNELRHLAGPGVFTAGYSISPDGNSVAVVEFERSPSFSEVWIHGVRRGTRQRLTTSETWKYGPVWAPDGRSVYFSAATRGWPDLERCFLDSPGEPELVMSAERTQVPLDFTADGRSLLIVSGTQLQTLPVTGDKVGEPEPFSVLPADPQRTPRLSPDGRLAAYEVQSDGRVQVYVRELGGEGRTIQVTVDGGQHPVWAPEGAQLYFVTGDDRVSTVELTTAEQLAAPQPLVLFQPKRSVRSLAVGHDGELLLNLEGPAFRPTSVLLRGRR